MTQWEAHNHSSTYRLKRCPPVRRRDGNDDAGLGDGDDARAVAHGHRRALYGMGCARTEQVSRRTCGAHTREAISVMLS